MGFYFMVTVLTRSGTTVIMFLECATLRASKMDMPSCRVASLATRGTGQMTTSTCFVSCSRLLRSRSQLVAHPLQLGRHLHVVNAKKSSQDWLCRGSWNA